MPVAISARDQVTIAQTLVYTSWLISKFENTEHVSGALSLGQTADPIGKVLSGTPMARVSATNMVRPAMYAVFTTDPASGNVVRVGAVPCKRFRVGDLVRLYAIADDSDLASSDRTITAIDRTTGDITFSGTAINPTIGDYIKGVGGGGDALYLSWLDSSSSTGQLDGDDVVIHQDGRPVTLLRRAIVDESELPVALPPQVKAALVARGFIFE